MWRERVELAGENGHLCMTMPEQYGGLKPPSSRWKNWPVAGFTGIGFGLHSEIVAPYILQWHRRAEVPAQAGLG